MIGAGGDLLKRSDVVLSTPANAVVRVAHPRRRAADSRLLVVRPGGMGDLILAQLAAQRLEVPTDEVVWLIERRSAAWARHQGLTTVVYDDSLPRAVRAIASRHAQVVNLEQLFGLSMAVARLATARGGRLTAFQTNRGARWADQTVDYDWRDAHESVEFGRALAAALDRPEPLAGPQPRGRESTGQVVLSLGGTHAPSRSIPASQWVAWLRGVVGDQQVEVTAGPLEEQLAQEVLVLLGAQGVRFSGSFEQVIDRIATAERLLAVDGGPVHIASFFGVPTDVVFTAGRANKWAPLAAGSRLHRRDDLPCQPCTAFGQVPPCPIAFACRADLPGSLSVFPVSR